jgi:methyl-accepting chemotaxis protein
MEKLESLETTEKGKGLITDAKGAIEVAKKANNEVIELALAGRDGEALAIFNKEALPLTEKIKQSFRALIIYQGERIAVRHEEAKQQYGSTRTMNLVTAAIALLFGMVSATIITRSITRPLSTARDVSMKLSGGDLTFDMPAGTKDETGQVLTAMGHEFG